MDKRVIFAVAGSGKTTHLISKLTLDKRFLLITYTENNKLNLRKGVIQKFGYFPDNITLLSYFTFLYSFCFKPLLSYKIKTDGINYWDQPPRFARKSEINYYYLDRKNRVYHNRIAKLCEEQNILPEINERIEKYFDYLFIDEIQDFAGNDFNFLKGIAKANCEILFVGDFFQHTYDTSYDGNVNKNLFYDYNVYKKEFQSMGLKVDLTSLCNSHRCSKSVCDFIREKLLINIYSVSNKETEITMVTTECQSETIFKDDSIVKLFYWKHSEFECYSENWGGSKGINHFNDVCVILNKETKKLFEKNDFSSMKPSSKNKFYVACSRARGKLFFMLDEFIDKYKAKTKAVPPPK